MDAANTGKKNYLSLFEKDYPLIRLFTYGNDILLYDAKPHFAFIISCGEMEVLADFLSGKTDKKIMEIHSAKSGAEQTATLIKKFNELKKGGLFIKGPVDEVSTVDISAIREKLRYWNKNILLRKFCLEVTEDCNFRCTYCKKTIRKDYKGHTKNNLSEEKAFRGIDYYFKEYTGFFRRLTDEKKHLLLQIVPPGISWYGGEPFLNFGLIKKTADYFKSLPWHEYSINVSVLKFTSNTNLSIMNDEILCFLVDNNVNLFASLDGPAEEHDRCRVFKNGKGTFSVAYRNLMMIKNFNRRYFKEQVSIFAVYTDRHDYNKCVEFTRSIGALRCQYIPAEYVGCFVADPDSALRDYGGSIKRRLSAFKKKAAAESRKERIEMEYFANIFPFARVNYDRPAGKNSLQISLTCPMGFDNLMLSADGHFLICHKVDDGMPIGDCERGLDFEKLAQLNLKYNSAVNNDECRSCWSVNFCQVCAASRMAHDRFINPHKKECDLFRMRAEYNFRCFIHLSLEHPGLLEKVFDYRNDPKSFITVIDINEF